MPIVCLTLAGLLLILGLAGYFPTGEKTALIPAAVGLVFAVLGAVALKESLRKHMMHAAVGLALLLFVGMAGMAGPKVPALLTGGELERPGAVLSQALLGLLCGVFVLLGVRSFIAARRKQRAAQAAAGAAS